MSELLRTGHLRYLVVCDENGRKSDPILQMYVTSFQSWEAVPVVELKSHEVTKRSK